jgi:SAM-dependent methyltransferase
MYSNDFIEITLRSDNLDRYPIRLAIFTALKQVAVNMKGHILDIGCGKMPYKNYLLDHSNITNYTGLDIDNALKYDPDIKADIIWDGQKIPIQNMYYDSAMATEVLEHCPEPEVVLKEIFRVLKPDGIFFFTVPFLWNLHEVPHDEYRYTPFSLERLLRNSGFNSIEIYAMGGWHASLAQMLGLWVRRSPISTGKKNILSFILLPVIKYLLKKDINPGKNFREGQMITGLYGWAKK